MGFASRRLTCFMLHDDDKAIYSQLLPCYANSQSMNNFSTHWIPKGRVDVKRSLGSAECYTPVVDKILCMKNGRLNGQWFWHKNNKLKVMPLKLFSNPAGPLESTFPNNSYRFWADLLHKWSFLGYDWHPSIYQKCHAYLLYYIINFSWPTFQIFFIMEE